MTTRILTGDCRSILSTLPDNSIDCVVTSPPYFGLRDYGNDNQIGLEASPQKYVAEMVTIFRDVRRVLKKTGTLWLNLGDSYSGSGKGQTADGATDPKNGKTWGMKLDALRPGSGRADGIVDERGQRNRNGLGPVSGLKQKDLVGIPWRVAFALQDDGWYLRQDIIWHKLNPMPESVRDRCTKAHEYLFLLSKSARYHYDGAAIAEKAIHAEDNRESKKRGDFNGKSEAMPGRNAFRAIQTMRNKRSVWSLVSRPFPGAHFATFPPKLVELCLKAGCPKNGVVLDPFGGAGTTSLVADRMGLHSVMIELNPDYAEMARWRLIDEAGMFADVAAE